MSDHIEHINPDPDLDVDTTVSGEPGENYHFGVLTLRPDDVVRMHPDAEVLYVEGDDKLKLWYRQPVPENTETESDN